MRILLAEIFIWIPLFKNMRILLADIFICIQLFRSMIMLLADIFIWIPLYVAPLAYEMANKSARHIITTMNNLILGLTFEHLIIEPVACKSFYFEDQATKERRCAAKQVRVIRSSAQRHT